MLLQMLYCLLEGSVRMLQPETDVRLLSESWPPCPSKEWCGEVAVTIVFSTPPCLL